MTERTCRFCGCTQDRACLTNDDACYWIAQDVCSNPVCDAAMREGLLKMVEGELPATMSGEDREAYALEIVQLTARVVGGHHHEAR